jgi:1-acyl-sn-glycerol-3-phosphate acyltransferase
LSKRKFEARKKETRKVIYYSDELNDEFSTAVIEPIRIDGDYAYDGFSRFAHFFWYRIVAMPIAFFYTKFAFRHQIKNAKVIKPYKRGGYCLYGNHTQDLGDACIPNMINKSKDKYVIVHPNNVSIPVIGHVTPSLGALPLPDDMDAYRNFAASIEQRIAEGHAVVIYPEAHIWPYYTGIRPFPDTSFSYPVKCGVPVFCFVNTYQKRRLGKKPRIVTYVEGPFYPDESLPVRARKKELRDRVHACMCELAGHSTVEQIQYVRKEKNNG